VERDVAVYNPVLLPLPDLLVSSGSFLGSKSAKSSFTVAGAFGSSAKLVIGGRQPKPIRAIQILGVMSLLPDVFIPEFRLGTDELFHQPHALRVVNDLHGDSS
jgi:hypothetical protein